MQMGVAVAASLLLGVTGTAFAASSNGNSAGIKLVHPGTLTVCTHLPYKPFEFVNDKRQIVGFEVDLVDLLAKKLGVGTKVISIDWNQITSGLVFDAHKCDIAMGGATITAKRAKAVLFSDPYFNATQALLVKKGSGIHGLADLKGKRLGAQTATTGQLYAQKHQAANGYKIVIFADLALETSAVSAGTVAAAIQDNTSLGAYALAHPDTELATEFDTGEHYGFMTKKDDPNSTKLMDAFNAVLAKAKQDGTYHKLFVQWFPGLAKKASEKSGS